MQTRTFSQLVSDQVVAIQGAAAGLVDFNVGSVLRAFTEAMALVALWLQGQVLSLLLTTRASTSTGADLDTWMGDYGLTRVGAIEARGDVVLTRFSTTGEAEVPLGSRVETLDGSQSFLVVADTNNPAWSAGRQVYVLSPGDGAITVPVVSMSAGAAGNVAANQVSVINGAMPGIDTVANPSGFAGGSDAESDAAFRVRFQLFIASLSKATAAAVAYAIAALQQNLKHIIVENESYAGSVQYGYFYVVIDDGTGTPTGDMITAVATAIDEVRPVAVNFGVFGPVVVDADVAMTISVQAGQNASAIAAVVEAAIVAFINGLGLGDDLHWSRIVQVAYDASPYVTNVTGVTVNLGTTDVVAAAKEVIRSGAVSVAT